MCMHANMYFSLFFLSLLEPETSILKDLTAKYHFDAFVSFHSGIKQIYVPYAGRFWVIKV